MGMKKEYLNNDDDDNLSKIYFQQFYDRISNIIELLVRHIRGQDVLHLHGKLGVGLDDTLSVHQLHLHRMFKYKVSDSLCYVSVRPDYRLVGLLGWSLVNMEMARLIRPNITIKQMRDMPEKTW